MGWALVLALAVALGLALRRALALALRRALALARGEPGAEGINAWAFYHVSPIMVAARKLL